MLCADEESKKADREPRTMAFDNQESISNGVTGSGIIKLYIEYMT